MCLGTNHVDASQHSSPAELVARLFEIQRMTTGELRAELERVKTAIESGTDVV